MIPLLNHIHIYLMICYHSKASVLNLASVSTLVTVPRIRTSSYLDMLAELAPALAGSRAGDELNIPQLPSLRRILVVSELSTESSPNTIEHATSKASADFRDAFMWSSPMHKQDVELRPDDVINLQFTR
jgi:hypothetical protein